MKKIILIISLLIICGSMRIAAAQNNDEHLNRMVECVNAGDFDCAITEIPQIENWTFDNIVDEAWFRSSKAVEFMNLLEQTGAELQEKGDYVSAAAIQYASVKFKYYVLGEKHPDYASAIHTCSTPFYLAGNFSAAKELVEKALHLYTLYQGKNYIRYPEALGDLGVMYYEEGNIQKAKELLLEAYQIYNSNNGQTYSEYPSCLNNLGLLFTDLGDYKQAAKYYSEELQILEKQSTKETVDYIHVMGNMGVLYFKAGDFQKAEKYSLESLEVTRKVFGENHPEYANSLHNLGVMYVEMGAIGKGESYIRSALDIMQKTIGEAHPNYFMLLNNLGSLCLSRGKYVEAEKYFQKSLQSYKQFFGEEHPGYALSSNNLGTLYQYAGNYDKSEQYLQKSLQVYQKLYGENHPEYANSLHNLADLYSKTGDYDKAKQYLEKVLLIQQNILGTSHPQYALALSNIGLIYDSMGEYTQALRCYFQAIQIFRDTPGELLPNYILPVNNLAKFYMEIDDYNKAEEWFLFAMQLCEQIYGKRHPLYSMALNNLGHLYSKIGEDQKAEQFFKEGLSICESIYGGNHLDYARMLRNLAVHYYLKKQYADANTYLQKARQVYLSFYLQSIGFMSEKQRAMYWAMLKDDFERFNLAFAYQYYPLNHTISQFAYDNELLKKGILLNSSNAIRQSIFESGDTILIRQWNDLNTKKEQIQVLKDKSPKLEYITQLQSEAEALEKEITRASAAYRENMRQWTITWDSVRAVLNPSHVAIEYMSAPLNDDTTMYCALLLRDTCSYPIMIPLFEEKEIKGLKDADLSKKIWRNVMPYMNAGETVFFSPTGVLHQIAIENLPYDETRTMGDVYEMVRLSSTRELAMHRTPVKHSSATLYGGIYYQEMDSVTMRQISEQYRTRDMSYEPALANDTTQRALPKYLPGTQKEIDSIQPILTKRHIQVKLHSKRDACEESVKALSGKKQNIIHLATHGFFWQNTKQSTDPMERCGLLFAGANTALSGHNERLAAGVDDGILTAKEISLLDLRDADVVVLSACETALGDITGEGVFGLQRAFKMAGARTILMALWKVNDDATRMLMTAFYRNYSKGQTKRAAFRNAQQEVRTYTRTETRPVENASAAGKNKMRKGQSSPITTETITSQPYKDPYYWAGFILLD